MPWVNDKFLYSSKLLQVIAKNYLSLYAGLPRPLGKEEIMNCWDLAEFKADFEMALNAIGGGKWHDGITALTECRNFSYTQLVVVADMLGIDKLPIGAVYPGDIDKITKIAYAGMRRFLNGGGK